MSEAAVGPPLAIDGGTPVRRTLLSYGGQWVRDEEAVAVAAAVRDPWLTGGPAVEAFEQALCWATGGRYTAAVSSGTAALHAAVYAAGVREGDEVVVPTLTFVASANSVVFQGGRPVLVDVDPETLNLDPAAAEAALTPRTRAIMAVHYAGHPCDLSALRDLARRRGLALIEDACHALGARYDGVPIGAESDFAAFSFHPVKAITTGEGGAVVCREDEAAARIRAFRNHGIPSGGRERDERGQWYYDMVDLGHNYRITDFQCRLGLTQLTRLEEFVERRRTIAARYARELADSPLDLPPERPPSRSAWHIYPVRLRLQALRVDRNQIFAALRAEGIGVNVHYRPVHLHSFYRERFGYRPGQFPQAESAFDRLLTLPLFPRMTDEDVNDVVAAVRKVLVHYRR